jgi:hypothetical protein
MPGSRRATQNVARTALQDPAAAMPQRQGADRTGAQQ